MGRVVVVVAIDACDVGVRICVIEERGLGDVGGRRGDEVKDCFRRDGSIEGGVVGKGNKSQ